MFSPSKWLDRGINASLAWVTSLGGSSVDVMYLHSGALLSYGSWLLAFSLSFFFLYLGMVLQAVNWGKNVLKSWLWPIHTCLFFFFSVDKTSLFLVLWFSWRAYLPIREDQGDFNHSGAYHTVLEVINILNFLTSTCLSSFNFIVEYVCMRNYVFCVYQPHQTVNNLKIKIWNINLTDLLGFLIIACFLCSSLGMYYCISNSIELVIVRG